MKKYCSIITALMLTAVTLATAVFGASFPEKKSGVYVYDPAGVISEETEADINARADALFAMSGAQIITVCVDTTDDIAIGEYAAKLFNQWQIGSPQRGNGMLCVMAIEDREYWLLQGSGIKKDITNGQLQVINNDYLEGHFAEGRYDEGAKAVFDQLLLKFEALYSIDIDKWDGKYIDFTYPDGTEVQTEEADESTAYNMVGFLTVFLWIAAAVVLVIVALLVISFMRRPRFVDGGVFRRRKYKDPRSSYVSPDGALNHARRTNARPNGQASAQRGQHPAGQHPAGQRPMGQRPMGQRPNGQRAQGQRSAGQIPQGQRPNGQHPNGQRPVGQRPQGQAQGAQGMNRPTQIPQSPSADRQIRDDSRTVYPDNPPYVNGNVSHNRYPGNNRNGGSQ